MATTKVTPPADEAGGEDTQLLAMQDELSLLKASNEAALERIATLESELQSKDQEIAALQQAASANVTREHILQQQTDLADLIASNEARKSAFDDAVKDFVKTIKSV